MSAKHVALVVEVPVLFTADLDDEARDDRLLDRIRVDRTVRLLLEVDGKEVVEVGGRVLGAQLVAPTCTDEELEERGQRRLRAGTGGPGVPMPSRRSEAEEVTRG